MEGIDAWVDYKKNGFSRLQGDSSHRAPFSPQHPLSVLHPAHLADCSMDAPYLKDI
jgi:hypothetical protein